MWFLATELRREGMGTRPSLKPGVLERGALFPAVGGQEEELGERDF